MSRRGRIIRLGILLVAAVAIALWWFLDYAPLPRALRELAPLTTVYLDTKDRVIAELASPQARSHRPLALADMGPWIAPVTIGLEDQRFDQHAGVDFRATVRAGLRRHGGGSTITQQLVKVVTGRKERSVFAKAKEALLALQLERRWTKAQILEAYLNRVSYGNRLVGVEAAAQAYFGKSAAALAQPEAIFLAGLPQSPSRLNPWTEPAAAARQFARSLQLLRQRGILPADETAVDAATLPMVARHLPRNAAPHFIQLAARPGQRGLIRCTLDLDLQQRAEQMVGDHLRALRRPDVTQAAMVVMENATGAVRALVGSRDFTASQINGAAAFRNCGSTLKPFLYATGIDRRELTAATLLPDTAEAVREVYPDYDPRNFAPTHLGPVRVREALGNSLNVPAVVAVNRLGAREVFHAIEDWGVQFDHPLEQAGAGFILGNVGVRLIDLTAAYAALARGGLAGRARFLADEPMPFRRVVAPETASIVTDILCDNSARRHSFGRNSALAFPIRVAAKTGTSAGFRDTWTAGFTADHTVGVWVGNFDGQPMDHAASAVAAAPLWRRMIEDLLQTNRPVPESSVPRVPICSLTGLRASPASPGRLDELFLPGTEPSESADAWFTPEGRPMLPKEYTAWCASADNHLGAIIQPSQTELAILSPRDGATYLIDGALPLRQQQLELRASGANEVAWKLNGQPIASSSPDDSILWPLAEGEWTLEAAHRQARATVRFTVRK